MKNFGIDQEFTINNNIDKMVKIDILSSRATHVSQEIFDIVMATTKREYERLVIVVASNFDICVKDMTFTGIEEELYNDTQFVEMYDKLLKAEDLSQYIKMLEEKSRRLQ